ncbi:hypothetical protein ACFO4L_13635 [Bacillus daqingensis]|uniref:Uncharacterized protein n=1 Tax=Bacillus daqingensis TaxID=872396 RepID=A0ABV9P017_9BACI
MLKWITFSVALCGAAAAVMLIAAAEREEADEQPVPEELQLAAEEGASGLGHEEAVMLEATESTLPDHIPSFTYIETPVLRASLSGMREHDQFPYEEQYSEETAVIIRFPDNEAFIYDVYLDRGEGEEALEAESSSGGAVMRVVLPDGIPEGAVLIVRDPLDRENPPQAVFHLPAEDG